MHSALLNEVVVIILLWKMELNLIANRAKVQFPFEEKESHFSANRAKVQYTLLVGAQFIYLSETELHFSATRAKMQFRFLDMGLQFSANRAEWQSAILAERGETGAHASVISGVTSKYYKWSQLLFIVISNFRHRFRLDQTFPDSIL